VDLGWSAVETYDPEWEESWFDVAIRGVSELSAISIAVQVGLVTVYATFGVRLPERRAELEVLADLFNRAMRSGTLFVLDDGRVVHRAAVDCSLVDAIDGRYVKALVAHLLDIVPVVDLPLVEIGHGATARDAVNRIWNERLRAPLRIAGR
jgi:hypothetical protein